MPRKTLALISGLVLVTVILFFVALRTSQKPQTSQTQATPTPGSAEAVATPSVPANTSLAFAPAVVTTSPGQQGTLDVTMDTSDNAVTAVQLELQYDPKVVTNVKVKEGGLFKNPVVLINKNDAQTGRVTYAFGILPNNDPVQGKGVVATITFTARGQAGTQSSITLLPESLVTARGVAESVRKDADVPVTANVVIGTAGTGDTMMKKETVAPTTGL